MKSLAPFSILVAVVGSSLSAQGLREVPQRFAYIQPVGLVLGVGQAGLEFSVGRSTSIELGGVGVYSVEDGVKVYGGGPGIGVRHYLGSGEKSGPVMGARVDGVWLQGDSRESDLEFLAIGGLGTRESDIYLGVGGLFGYRWLSRSGFLVEPSIGYEYFAGNRPLVAGSRKLQRELGLSMGVALGFAW